MASFFVKVDVTIFRHYRVLDIPPEMQAEALGVWLAALCYTREHELDGFCPLNAIREIATERAIDQLISVGLLTRDEHNGRQGVVVCNYSKHNDTSNDISLRKETDRIRKRRTRSVGGQRDGGTSPVDMSDRTGNGTVSDVLSDTTNILNDVRPDTDSVPTDRPADDFGLSCPNLSARTSENVPPLLSSVCDLRSGSRSEISPSESSLSKDSQVSNARACNSVPVSASNYDAASDQPERYIQISDKISQELRSVAEIARVLDIDGAWLKFCGHYAGKWAHVAGKWQLWCVNEANRERLERDRKHAQQSRYTPHQGADLNPYDSQAVRAERTRREADMRQAERDAVPAPIADLMAAIGIKRQSGAPPT